ncbi:MAG: S-layer homology domain-containing protein, partial [Clostridiaceae bacterium]|nr:S-layer homology domain-containing protein [Clostridiaceae bacterium]
IYSANGNATFGWGCSVSGNIYINSNNVFTIPNLSNYDFASRVLKLDQTNFEAPEIPFLTPPMIDNYVNSYDTGDEEGTVTVSQNTHYGSLSVGKTLIADVSAGDIYIITDSISLYAGGEIITNGNGTLYVFINGDFDLSGSFRISGNENKKVLIFVSGNVNIVNNSENVKMYADIYVGDGNIRVNTTELYGNVVSNSSTFFEMKSSISTIYGTVYVPCAAASISNSGKIQGRLFADSLNLNSSEIAYDESYTDLVIPNIEDEDPPIIPTEMDIPDGESLLINFPYAYLYGNDDGTVTATNSIKREEAVALIYRLLKQDNKLGGFEVGTVEPFENVESNRWSKSALEFAKYIGVYRKNYISVQGNVTKGEVAKIVTFALRIKPDDTKTISFSDLQINNPYYHYIKALVDIGVLEGYDNLIEPDKDMTRAEFVTMINRLIGRGKYHELPDNSLAYTDLDGTEWYYEAIMKASFGYFQTQQDGIYLINPNGKPDRSLIDYN